MITAEELLAMKSWAERRMAIAAAHGSMSREDIERVMREVFRAMQRERDALMSSPGEDGQIVADRDGVRIGTWRATVDGEIVGSWSEAWRAECEARHVLGMPSRASRLKYLAAVEARRGKPSRDALQDLATRIWQQWRRTG